MPTFENQVVEPNHACISPPMQPRNRSSYNYPNGSIISLFGMNKPERLFSTEWDLVYVQEVQEFIEDEWESLLRSLRNGVMAFHQLCGDCNPEGPNHWIKRRSNEGKLELIETTHEDNPRYYDVETGQLTESGLSYIKTLDGLSGVRKERLRYGRWVAAEGQVYSEFDTNNIVDSFKIPADWRKLRSIDLGFNNPTVVQWWAISPNDEMYLYREWYKSQMIVEDHAKKILELSGDERYIATICDHDAEDRKTLERHGVRTKPAYKAIERGIQSVEARIRKGASGKPRLFIMKDALVEVDPLLEERKLPIGLKGEIFEYVYPKVLGKVAKEVPMKENDHACLIAGTLVTTKRGPIVIEDVTTDDFVLTRNGYFRVKVAGLSGENVYVMEIELANGLTLTGTRNHEVYIEGIGFIEMGALQLGDHLYTLHESENQVVSIKAVNEPTDVYNLSVYLQPEYYANEILVHNCDAMRYAVAYVDKLDNKTKQFGVVFV
jgi:hypothetical protein